MTTDPPSTPKGESQLHAVVTGEEVGRARAAQGLRRSSKAAVRAAEARPEDRCERCAGPAEVCLYERDERGGFWLCRTCAGALGRQAMGLSADP